MEWIDELLGLTAWEAEIGIGTHLTINLGEKYFVDRNYTRGEWRIWAAGVPWRIALGGALIINSEFRNRDKEKVEILNGRVLQRVLFEKSFSHAVFQFSGDVVLEVFIENPDGFELIMLSKRESYFLDGTGKIGHQKNREPLKSRVISIN